MTALAAAGARSAEIENLVFGERGLFEKLEAVALPFALHHDRQSVDDDVEKTADRQADDEQAGEVYGRVLIEYG